MGIVNIFDLDLINTSAAMLLNINLHNSVYGQDASTDRTFLHSKMHLNILCCIYFLFCYERDFMMSLSDDKKADVIDAFNTPVLL